MSAARFGGSSSSSRYVPFVLPRSVTEIFLPSAPQHCMVFPPGLWHIREPSSQSLFCRDQTMHAYWCPFRADAIDTRRDGASSWCCKVMHNSLIRKRACRPDTVGTGMTTSAGSSLPTSKTPSCNAISPGRSTASSKCFVLPSPADYPCLPQHRSARAAAGSVTRPQS